MDLHPYYKAYLKCKNGNISILYRELRNRKIKGGGSITNQINDFIITQRYLPNYDDINIFTKNIEIFVGGTDQCLHAIINYENKVNNNNNFYKNDKNVAILEYFGYSKRCNIHKDLEKTTGTQRMMNSFFKYIKKHHPDIKYIKLQDETNIDCNDVKINLYQLYILKYGKSYYEKHFNFNISTEDNNKDNIKKYYENIELAKIITIDKNEIKKHLLNIYKNMNEIKDTIKNNYITLKIIDNFLSDIKDGELVRTFLLRYKPTDEFCNIFKDFIEFIFTKKLNRISTLIYVKQINIFNYRKSLSKRTNILKKQHSKFTRKRQISDH